MVIVCVDSIGDNGARFYVHVFIECLQPLDCQVHCNGFMWMSIFWIIDNGTKQIPGDQENITWPKHVVSPGHDNLRFTLYKPDEHMMFKSEFRLEQLVFVAG